MPELLDKVRTYRPRIVCFVGKQIGDTFLRVLQKQVSANGQRTVRVPHQVAGFWHTAPGLVPEADLGYGVMPFCLSYTDTSYTLFYVTPSTSARVTRHLLPDKIRLFAHIPTLLRAPEADWQPVQMPCLQT